MFGGSQVPHKRLTTGSVSDLVRIETRSSAGLLLAAFAAVCLAIFTSAATGAGSGSQRHSATSAVLELYALESELAGARSRVDAIERRRRALAAERASTRQQLDGARRALTVSQQRLQRVVRRLYEAGEIDSLAVLLGATSLDDALSGIDGLERTAAQSRAVGRQARSARATATRVAATLARRERELAALAEAARRQADSLAAAAARQRAFVDELGRRESAARAAEAQRQAVSAQRRSAALTSASDSTPAGDPSSATGIEPVQIQRGPRTLTVDAVAYSLPGHTASGLPVGRGVVAVDPNVIPLGTRMLVPGYGPAVAADVGSAVQGLIIDLWFPTLAEARAWGRRTVTVTLL